VKYIVKIFFTFFIFPHNFLFLVFSPSIIPLSPWGRGCRVRGNLEFSPSPNPLPSREGGIITICVQNRECLFGEIKNGEMRFNDAGRMVKKIWEEIPKYYGINLDEFIIITQLLRTYYSK